MAKLRLIGRLVGIYLVALGIVSCDLPRLDRGGDIAEPVPSVVVVVVTPAPAQATQEQPAEFAPPPAPQAAQVGNALIRIQPDEQQINVGVTATAEVLLADVVNLVGADVELRFDPALLQVQDADPNTAGVQIQPGDFLAANFVVTNNADNSTGIIRYAVTQVAPTPPVSGSGVLFRVTFQSLAQGASDLSFTTVQLANSDFQEIPATPDNGRINIGQVVATPTPFPSPTSVGPSPTPSPTLPIGVTPIPSITPTPGPEATPTPTVTIPTPTPLPPPPPTPTPPLANLPFEAPRGATVGFCHRVEPGEDILTISTRFGVSPQMINVVNDLYPPGHTFVHQPLFIPTLLGHGPNFYRVEPGDTLTGIAGSCHLKPDILARANGIDENALIGAGQFLFIPIPPFPPPSRYPYPLPIVPVPAPCCPDPYK